MMISYISASGEMSGCAENEDPLRAVSMRGLQQYVILEFWMIQEVFGKSLVIYIGVPFI